MRCLEDESVVRTNNSDKAVLELLRSWFRLLTGDFIYIHHSLHSQKYLDEYYVNNDFQAYKFNFYGYTAEEVKKLATELKILPQENESFAELRIITGKKDSCQKGRFCKRLSFTG